MNEPLKYKISAKVGHPLPAILVNTYRDEFYNTPPPNQPGRMNRQETESPKAPGAGARAMVTRRKLARVILILLALATATTLFAVGLNARNGIVSLMVLAGLWFVDRGTRSDLSLFVKRTGDAERGAQAEEAVGAVLNHLPANCRVLHDVAAGYGNIDHVVLRDDGVIFLIETVRGRIKTSHQRSNQNQPV